MEQFDQLLTCAICLDRYRNPKLLPCQHSFCMEPCMEGLINYVTRQVKCPECRAEHRIPYQGIAAYPTNVTLQRFLELHIEITGELPDPTSGQVMERCGVCSEKSYCSPCCHCDKKICPECKESHLDILRREIVRVNNQVRRTLPRLQDALGVVDKNMMQLQQNCTNIIEEVDGIYLRLTKALKDRTDAIKSEIEVFLAKEMKGLTGLRTNLEQEVSNFDANSEFAEKHITAEGGPPAVPWDDNELMDTKDIFLRTMEFIRNFETEPGDYHRRVRFFIPQDPNQLANTLANLGELTINYSQKSEQSMYPLSQPPSAPSLGPGLMRSKSDHRVAAQFRQAEERYLAYGSDNNDDTTSTRQRYFGDRHNTSRVSDRYGRDTDSRRSDYDYDDSPAETHNRRPSRFRSRFMRHHDSGDSDNEPSSRSVRFHESGSADGTAPKKERQRVLDTEDAARGPLSGITRLADSPRVIKRIQEAENKGRKRDSTVAKPTPPTTLNLSATAQSAQMNSPRASQRTTSRQVSEEDEIAKIKKQNKGQEASQAAEATARKPDSSVPSTPTSTVPTRTPTNTEQSRTPAASRQTSTTSEASRQSESSSSTVTPTADDGRKRSVPSKTESTAASSGSSSRTSPVVEEPNGTDRTGRKVGRVSVDRFNKSSSESSTSAESSTHSSPVRNTGAAFSTGELRNRFSRKSSTGSNGESGTPATTTAAATPATMATTTTRSRFGNVSSTPATTTSATSSSSTPSSGRYGSTSTPSTVSSSNGAAAAAAPHRFQSRFLGRAGTPTAEASRGSENSESSSSDDSSDSSESDSAPPPSKPSVGAGSGKDRELARTDIGPLLARSAQARDSYPAVSSNASSSKQPETPSSYVQRSRANAAAASSAATSTPSGRAYGSSARYGADAAGSSSATGGAASSIARSRTGSSLSEDLENKYPLTSKYLNRSRANMADPAEMTSSSSYSGSSSTPRYSSTRGYQSRFLNKSKSSAALASESKDADGEDEADDDDAEEAESSSATPSQQQQTLPASGEERYPSGRSRYAALKDRRSRLARSKSSHEVVPGDPSTDGSSSASHDNYGQLGGEVGDTGLSSLEPTSPTAEAGSGSSLSTWARYLKNKYGPRNKEASDNQPTATAGGNKQQQAQQHQQRFSRSRSIGSSPANSNNINNNNGRWTAEGDKDSSNNLITSPSRHQYMQKRKILMKFGTRGSEPGCFTWPRGVAVGPDNSIVVADSSNHRVQVFDSNGQFMKEFGYYGNGEGEFDCLAGVAINRIGQYIIADRYNHRIQVFDPSGRFLRVFGSQGTTDGKFSYPWGVTTDALGFIYVCDKENHRVQVFQSDGTFVGKFGSMGNRPGQLEHPHYIAVSSTNRVIVSDSNNHRIQVFDVNGKVIATFGNEGSDEGQFKFPRGVAVDDQGYIIVADSGNNRIQVFTADGLFVKAFGCWGSGDGEFKGLEGIAVLPNGNIVVCDRENHRIQVF